MKTRRLAQTGPQGLLLTLFVIVCLGAAQWWLWQYVRLAAQGLHIKQTQTAQLADIMARIATIDEVYQKQSSLLEQLGVSFPPLTDTPQVIERLERLAAEQAVTLTIRSIGDGQEPAATKKTKVKVVPLPVVIRATGSTSQLLAYLEAVEHVPELTALESWSLSPNTTVTGHYVLDGKVVFYLQP